MIMTSAEYSAIFVPLLLTAVVLGGIVLEILVWKDQPRLIGIYVLTGIIAVFLLAIPNQVMRLNIESAGVIAFSGTYFFEMFSAFFDYLFLVIAMVTIVLSLTYWTGRDNHRGEYYLLIATATIGMCLMASAHDLLILFLGIEIMSIAIYVLVGSETGRPRSGEASLKYLLLGAFASAILLFGMALLYGLSGKIDYENIATGMEKMLDAAWMAVRAPTGGDEAESYSMLKLLGRLTQLAQSPQEATMLLVSLFGVGFLMVGFFFKVAAVPFHMWTPDVYEGAPAPITAFMATGVKAAAFAALVRFGCTALSPLWGLTPLYEVLAVVAILTMTLGNVVAIAQSNLKRMLAYSSIAHAGYLLVGVAALVASGQYFDTMDYTRLAQFGFTYTRPVLFYLLAYTLTNLGAFGVIVALGRDKPGAESLRDFSGLHASRPGLALAMAICMLSLAGVPPLAGFTAKFYLFESAVVNRLYVLAVIGVLNSVVSAYYYLRVLMVMYMKPAEEPLPEEAPSRATGAMVVSILMASMVVLLGIYPSLLIKIIEKAVDLGMLLLPIH